MTATLMLGELGELLEHLRHPRVALLLRLGDKVVRIMRRLSHRQQYVSVSKS